MTLAAAIVQAMASIIAYFAVRGIDQILGKWIAYVTIAFEKVATQKALATFKETRDDLARNMVDQWKQWEEWRKSVSKSQVTYSEPPL